MNVTLMREPGGAHCGERCLPDKQGGREEVIINHGLAPVHRRINAVEMIFSVPVGPDKVIVTSGSACSPRSWSVCDFFSGGRGEPSLSKPALRFS